MIVFQYDFFLIKNDELNNKLVSEIPVLVEKINVLESLSRSDLNTIIDRYNSNILSILEDARTKHKNVGISNVPMWAWLLIIYLGYDDIYRLFTSWLLVPVTILVIFIILLKTNPYFRPFNTILSAAFDSIFSNVKQKIL